MGLLWRFADFVNTDEIKLVKIINLIYVSIIDNKLFIKVP